MMAPSTLCAWWCVADDASASMRLLFPFFVFFFFERSIQSESSTALALGTKAWSLSRVNLAARCGKPARESGSVSSLSPSGSSWSSSLTDTTLFRWVMQYGIRSRSTSWSSGATPRPALFVRLSENSMSPSSTSLRAGTFISRESPLMLAYLVSSSQTMATRKYLPRSSNSAISLRRSTSASCRPRSTVCGSRLTFSGRR
mmetsp:Transcript_15474/g.46784  ORF Transcript_15474/g.46784 Transcript_15474/m.46784 type:complete len:200 (+) Transcript_15474:2112-2711(+)